MAASFTAAGICGGVVFLLMILAALTGVRLVKPKAGVDGAIHPA